MGRRGAGPGDVPVSETLTTPSLVGWEPALDRIGRWVAATILLVAIAYGPWFLTYSPHPVSTGFRGY
ncbi:MAG TPA: hypothetical protein VFS11_07600 [Gemmatimonadales bacterium]|nr:hypothetical protein [Gemmatimonadales bacterium]